MSLQHMNVGSQTWSLTYRSPQSKEEGEGERHVHGLYTGEVSVSMAGKGVMRWRHRAVGAWSFRGTWFHVFKSEN